MYTYIYTCTYIYVYIYTEGIIFLVYLCDAFPCGDARYKPDGGCSKPCFFGCTEL